MFCTSCGTKNVVDSNYCRQCGGKLDRLTAAKISADDFERALPEEEQVSALLERAYGLRKDGNLDGAIALCEEALRLRANSTSTHSLLGQLYEQSGNRESAIREYERVLQLNPGSIADRVNLDELRAQTGETGTPRAHNRVVMAAPQPAPSSGYARFTSVGIALALMALGGLIVLELRPKTSAADSTTSTPSSAAAKNGTPGGQTAPPIAAATNAQDTTPGATGAGKTSPGMPAPPTRVASAVPPSNAVTQPPIVYMSGPPQIRYVNVPPAPAVPAAATSRLPGPKKPKSGTNAAGNGNPGANGSKRVMLPGDPDEGGNGPIVVPVNGSDISGRTGVKQSEDNNPANRVTLDKPNTGGARPAPGPVVSTTEARSFVAMGEEKKRQQDYRAAIAAFTKALASSGDQTGYILQQRALCYQYLTDLNSAKTDYARAIDEYHKLEPRDPETARNGIRACEKGIKACGN